MEKGPKNDFELKHNLLVRINQIYDVVPLRKESGIKLLADLLTNEEMLDAYLRLERATTQN